MPSKLLLLALAFQPVLIAETVPAHPPAAAKAPTLDDVIFDVRYLKQVLPPQTIISPIDPLPTLPSEVDAAIKAARLDEASQFSVLPASGKALKRDKMIAPHFPDSRRQTRIPGKASFLLYVGADGKVIGLYCYEASDHVYAVAAAEAILVWRFKPAKVDNTATPVLTAQLMEFEFR